MGLAGRGEVGGNLRAALVILQYSSHYRQQIVARLSGKGALHFVTMSGMETNIPFWGAVTSTIDWCEVRQRFILNMNKYIHLTLFPIRFVSIGELCGFPSKFFTVMWLRELS